MRSRTYCKRLFTIGAIWNWGVAILLTSLAFFALPQLNWFLVEVPSTFLWYYLFMGLVAVYGLGYFWVAQAPERNRDIIKMGVLGKLIVFALVVPAWLNGEVTLLGASAAMVDFIFTLLFVDVLTKNQA